MIVLESKPEVSYTLAVLDGVEPDALLKAGVSIVGDPVILTDGRPVGRVLSNGRSPAAFRAAGRTFPMETSVVEILWANCDFQKAAEQADLRLEDGRVLLVGDMSEPTNKSMHRGWGRRLVAGQTIRFA